MHAVYANARSLSFERVWPMGRAKVMQAASFSHFGPHPHQGKKCRTSTLDGSYRVVPIEHYGWSMIRSGASGGGCTRRHKYETGTATPPLRCTLMRRNASIRNLLRAKIETDCSADGENGLHHIMIQFLRQQRGDPIAIDAVAAMGTARFGWVCACLCAMWCIHKSSCQLLCTYLDWQSITPRHLCTHTHALFCVHPSDAEFRANAFALESTVRCTPNQKSLSSRMNLSNAKIDRFFPF